VKRLVTALLVLFPMAAGAGDGPAAPRFQLVPLTASLQPSPPVERFSAYLVDRVTRKVWRCLAQLSVVPAAKDEPATHRLEGYCPPLETYRSQIDFTKTYDAKIRPPPGSPVLHEAFWQLNEESGEVQVCADTGDEPSLKCSVLAVLPHPVEPQAKAK
jgi:hypothetical protein